MTLRDVMEARQSENQEKDGSVTRVTLAATCGRESIRNSIYTTPLERSVRSMCAKAISYTKIHNQTIDASTEVIEDKIQSPNLCEFGEYLEELIGTQISVLGDEHIRIPTPQTLDDMEIHNLRTLIANSLHLPVTIFREKKFIEIMGI